MLKDYTKYDSAFLRFLSGHWGRNNTEQATQIVHAIDREAINEPEDLVEELTRIKPANPIGSYARRICFLTYHQPRPDRVIIANSNESDVSS